MTKERGSSSTFRRDCGKSSATFLENCGKVPAVFFCWAKQKYETLESPVSDFEIEGKTFEVGGHNKGKKQIEDVKDGYVVKDNLEYVFDNQVPLWMFGFLY